MEIHPNFDERSGPSLARVLGLLLVACGATLIAFVVWNAYQLYESPEAVAIVSWMKEKAVEVVLSSDEKVAVSGDVLKIAGYVLAIIVLFIISGIAQALLTGGIMLLNGGDERTLARIEQHVKKIAEQNATNSQPRSE